VTSRLIIAQGVIGAALERIDAVDVAKGKSSSGSEGRRSFERAIIHHEKINQAGPCGSRFGVEGPGEAGGADFFLEDDSVSVSGTARGTLACVTTVVVAAQARADAQRVEREKTAGGRGAFFIVGPAGLGHCGQSPRTRGFSNACAAIQPRAPTGYPGNA